MSSNIGQTVLDNLAPLPEKEGLYLPDANTPDAYTDDQYRHDHPMLPRFWECCRITV